MDHMSEILKASIDTVNRYIYEEVYDQGNDRLTLMTMIVFAYS